MQASPSLRAGWFLAFCLPNPFGGRGFFFGLGYGNPPRLLYGFWHSARWHCTGGCGCAVSARRLFHCTPSTYKIALLLQKPPKRGFQHQGPQHHSPEVTPGAGGEVLVFFPAVLKLGLWKLRAIPERGGFRSKIFPSGSPQPRACITTQSQPRARWVPTLSWGRSPQGEQGGSGEQALHSQAAVGVKHAGRERGAFAAPVPPWRPPRSGAHPGEVRIQRAWPRSEPVLGCRMRPAAAPCFLCCIFSPLEFGFVCVSAGFSPTLASRGCDGADGGRAAQHPMAGHRQRGGAGGGVKLPLGRRGGMDEGCFLRYSPESYSR